MTTRFIPKIGDKGYYQLAAPFSVPENQVHECKAIRQISELLEDGIDVFKEYYESNGIDENIYDQDVENDVEIIFLMSDNNRWVFAPSRYLLGYPNMNGEPYRRMAVTIALPAMPLTQDFSHALTQLQETIQVTLGVPCELDLVVRSNTLQVPDAEHRVIHAQRVAQMERSTPSARAAYWRRAYDALKIKYDALVTHFQ